MDQKISYYKFMDTRDIDYVVVDGTIRVSSFDRFRKMEAVAAGAIADKFEAQTELTFKDTVTIRDNSPELTRLNLGGLAGVSYQQFARLESGGTITINKGTIFRFQTPNMFIYSMSYGELDTLSRALCDKSKTTYDACIEIKDPSLLNKIILQTGRVKELNCPAGNIFAGGVVRSITYEPRSRDFAHGPAIQPDPFKKDTAYKSQSEVRLVLTIKSGVTLSNEVLTIQIANPGDVFEERFRA
jgi:hypothetical protein